MQSQIAVVRRFSRFYTRSLGLIGEGLLGGASSLAQARVIYELAHRHDLSARDLGLDAGYLSRILGRLEEQGIVERTPDPADARASRLAASAAGREAFGGLDAASRAVAHRRHSGARMRPLAIGPIDSIVTRTDADDGWVERARDTGTKPFFAYARA